MPAHPPDDIDAIAAALDADGYVRVEGLFDEGAITAMEKGCTEAQQQMIEGSLSSRYRTATLIDDRDGTKRDRRPNYVIYVTELVAEVHGAVHHPVLIALMQRWLGPGAWLKESSRFGVVYQDARPGRESGYSRIGWHTDWQSGPQLDIWPSLAFTIHIDATSPANGFLRVVPGSHRWATPAPYQNVNRVPVPADAAPAAGYTDQPPPVEMPPTFGKVPGEVGVYCERGDVLFHDAYLWHAAARATDDAAMRRHIRGSWFGGHQPDDAELASAFFVKNAAR